jgi:hypothetical protein
MRQTQNQILILGVTTFITKRNNADDKTYHVKIPLYTENKYYKIHRN